MRGILTHHHIHIPGAVLQAYAQAKLLNAEIIDYRFDHIEQWQNTNKKRSMVYQGFVNKLPISKRYIDDSFHKDYDMIIIGSDEVWKLSAGKYSKPWPNVFWGGDWDCETVAFSASANRLNIEKLTEEQKKEMKKKLSKFSLIGVRDGETKNFIESLGVKCIKTCDPTLVYNFPETELELKHKRAVGLYINDGEYLDNCMKQVKGHVYSLYKKTKHTQTDLSALCPFDFIQAIKQLGFVITDSYHTAIFCLKFGVPFCATENTKGKIYDLLADLGVLHYYNSTPREVLKVHKRVDLTTIQETYREGMKCLV